MDTKLKNYRPWLTAIGIIAAIIGCAIGVLCISYVGLLDRMTMYTQKGFDTKDEMSIVFALATFAAILFVAGIILAIVFCGKKVDGKVQLRGFDNWIPEIHLILGGTAFGLGIAWLHEIIYTFRYSILSVRFAAKYLTKKELAVFKEDYYYVWQDVPEWFQIMAFAAIFLACTLVFAFCVLAIVKKLKAKQFWSTTLIGKLIKACAKGFERSDRLYGKVIGILILAAILSATWIGTIAVIIAICIVVPKLLDKYVAIKIGVEEVKKGNLNYQIPVEGEGELDKFAESINGISESYSVAVANELKNQRLKTDLISNVSHDIKTPLTSMITYVDLLKKEGLDSPNASNYVTVIDEKTQRLKKLTEDLFEAAKASSGAINVNMEAIDMTAIANQALGELDDKLAASELNVIFNKHAENSMVMADGALLWRVIENLLVNVSKYALRGSRVYMDIFEKDEDVILEIKNISSQQLNIDPDELMERFTRGDNSRTTEGSGLGLSIAKDLTKNMGGDFRLAIDGDLFKAMVSFKKPQ